MKALAAALLFWATCGACAQDYRLPFDGRWFVMQGGDTPNVNHHMGVRAQWYGVDFAKVGGPSGRALSRRPKPDMIEDFYSWGAPVRSPVDGEVISVMNEFPDNPLGLRHERNPAGNHVVIKAGGDRYVLLAHFQHRSIVVKPGQRLRRGDPLGKCGNSGNSGNSDFPHIHMHVQDTPVLNEGTGHNMVFAGIDVELNGKQFRGVDWPLMRGLFVSMQ